MPRNPFLFESDQMKRLGFESLTLLAFLVAGFLISRTATAAPQAHLHSLAAKIDQQASRLLQETIHYRHTPSYATMVAHVANLRVKARHMRVTTFVSSSFHHLEEDLRIVEQCFHEIVCYFDRAEIHAANRNGHVHGTTRHVKILLENMEATIDHMQDHVRALRRGFGGWGTRTIIQQTTYRTPSYWGSSSIYGSSRIHSGHNHSLLHLYSSPRSYCPNPKLYHGHRYESHYRGSAGGLQINRGNFSFRIKF